DWTVYGTLSEHADWTVYGTLSEHADWTVYGTLSEHADWTVYGTPVGARRLDSLRYVIPRREFYA
ncbi:MAG: hypothetical protein WAV20_25310, partial [Blastocatellia bacterium]